MLKILFNTFKQLFKKKINTGTFTKSKIDCPNRFLSFFSQSCARHYFTQFIKVSHFLKQKKLNVNSVIIIIIIIAFKTFTLSSKHFTHKFIRIVFAFLYHTVNKRIDMGKFSWLSKRCNRSTTKNVRNESERISN